MSFLFFFYLLKLITCWLISKGTSPIMGNRASEVVDTSLCREHKASIKLSLSIICQELCYRLYIHCLNSVLPNMKPPSCTWWNRPKRIPVSCRTGMSPKAWLNLHSPLPYGPFPSVKSDEKDNVSLIHHYESSTYVVTIGKNALSPITCWHPGVAGCHLNQNCGPSTL